MSNETIVRVTADASGYEAGMERAKRSAESFIASQEAAAKRTKAAQDAITEAAVNGSKASASAINSFVQSAAKMADTAGKTRSQLLEQKAAQLGVTEAMAGYIAKIREQEKAHGSAAEAAHKLNFATAGARREMLVLAHEASQGNWKRFAGSLMVLGERTDAMSLIMNKSVLSVGALVGVVALAASITYKAAEEMGKYGDEIEKISRKTGASTDSIQQWMFAAKASGIDAKETVKSFNDLGEVQNKAIHGNKDAAAAFAAIGISLADLKKSNPADLLPKIADAFQQSADGASKAAVANELFGASGENLIPLLDRGSAGLAALGIEARNAGAIIGGPALAQMQAFEARTQLAKAQMEAMSMSAKTELLPTITAISEAFSNNASMGPMLHEFYSDVASVAKGAAIGLAAIVTAAKEAGAGISMIANIANRAGAGDVQGVVDAWKNGIKEIGDAQKSYDDFTNRILSGPKELAGPPASARNQKAINFSKGGNHQPKEKAYHDDAAARFLQQLRDQDAELRLQLSTTDKLTGAEKELAKFNQEMVDWKGKKLTLEQQSLVAHQDEIRIQLQTNVELEKAVKHHEDIAKLKERSAQIDASIASYQNGQSEQHGRQLDAFGMGSEALKNVQAVKSIYAEYQRLQEQLDKATPKDLIGGSDYMKASADIKAGLDQSLADYAAYYAALKEKQADWTNGASAAFANYIDSARNVAGEVEAAYTHAFKGIEDALVNFETTGKLNFKSLADSILADLNRMATHQLMAKLMETTQSAGGSGLGGFLSSLTGVSAKAAKGFGGATSASIPVPAAGVQNAAALNATTATVATMTVGTLIAGVGAGCGASGGDALSALLGSLGQGDMAGAFGFTATGITGSAGAVASGAMMDTSTVGMTALMGLATGGPVDSGTPYMVGEKGPELFVPGQSGKIVPNHALRGTGSGNSDSQAVSRSQSFYMDISVPPGTTRQSAQQQAAEIMRHANIAMARNG